MDTNGHPGHDFIAAATARNLVVHDSDGRAVIRMKILHAAVMAAAGVIVAPRITAAAAMGALFKGMSLEIEGPAEEPA